MESAGMDSAGTRLQVLSGHLVHQGAPQHLSQQACSSPLPAPAPVPTAVIVGGVVLDIQAQAAEHELQRGGSVPGKVCQVPGGVARNIADAASQLCADPTPPPLLVSVVGQDPAGQSLMSHLRSLRLNLSSLKQVPDMPTASVCVMLDRGGDVASCVADVSGPERHLTPTVLQHLLRPALDQAAGSTAAPAAHRHTACTEPHSTNQSRQCGSGRHASACILREQCEPSDYNRHYGQQAQLQLILHHQQSRQHGAQPGSFAGDHTAGGTAGVCRPLVVVETNLSEAAVAVVCTEAAARQLPVLLEPVSVPKSARAVSSLHLLDWVTPNANELMAMAQELCRRRGQDPPSSQRCGGAQTGATWPRQVPHQLLQLLPTAAMVLSAGTRRIVVTLGAEGAALLQLRRGPDRDTAAASSSHGSQSNCIVSSRTPAQHGSTAGVSIRVAYLPAPPCEVVSVNGAGDTLVGGLVAALLSGCNEVQAVAAGMAAAASTVRSAANVAPGLQWAALNTDMQWILKRTIQFDWVV